MAVGAWLCLVGQGLALVNADVNPAPNGEKASSTAIRHALAEGDLPRARAMLGRAYEVRGVVAHGDERGRELGFPTANVRSEEHTSELQSLMRISYAVFCLKKKTTTHRTSTTLTSDTKTKR